MTTFSAPLGNPFALNATTPPQTPASNTELPWSPKELREMIEEDLRVRRAHTDRSRELIDMYHAFDEGFPLNHCFEWCRTIVPQLVYSNPKVKVTESGMENQETYAVNAAMRSLLEREDYGFVETFQAIAYDVQFDFGVCALFSEPTPEYDGGLEITPQWIRPYRVSPRLFGVDHRAPEFMGRPRYAFHLSVATREELLNEADAYGQPIYDAAAVNLLQDEDGMDMVRKELGTDGARLNGETSIAVYEVYLYHQEAWVTIGFGSGNDAQFLRTEPQRKAYCCPRGGPYIMFGTYPGIDYIYPVPNLGVTKELLEDINAHRNLNRENAGQAKKIGIAGGGHQKAIQAVRNAKSGDVIAIAGYVPGMIQELELGGVSKESFEYQQYQTEQLDRLSGLTEIARGNVPSNSTATAVAQAGGFTAASIDHSKNRFACDTTRALSRIGDVLMHCDQMIFPLTMHDEDGTTQRGIFYGGQIDPAGSGPFRRNITVEIEPYSYEYVNKAQLRQDMTEAFTQGLAIMQAAQANPAIKAGPMIDDLFQTLNIPRAAKRYFDTEIQAMQQELQKMQMAAMAGAAVGMPPQGAGPAPSGRGQPGTTAGNPGGMMPNQASPV